MEANNISAKCKKWNNEMATHTSSGRIIIKKKTYLRVENGECDKRKALIMCVWECIELCVCFSSLLPPPIGRKHRKQTENEDANPNTIETNKK